MERTPQFFEGWCAFQEGVRQDQNPYPTGTESSREWNDGWRECALTIEVDDLNEIDYDF